MENLKGEKFGKLKVKYLVVKERVPLDTWLCECKCGRRIQASGKELLNRKVEQCSHCGSDNILENSTQTYIAWEEMIKKCAEPTVPICVCKSWRNNYYNFLKDMGIMPKDSILERLNKFYGFSKDNCYWVPKKYC